MFKEKHGGFGVDINNEPLELVCNYRNEDEYVKNLSKGKSFYLSDTSRTDYRITFSIENAVKMRDFLDENIKVAEDSGYFNKVEMTLEEIEKELGKKIKIVSSK